MSGSRRPLPRTQVRRLPAKQVHDREVLDQLIDEALVGHLAVVDDGQPFVLPVAVVRDGDRLLLHGSAASRLFRALAAGAPTCLTVTLVDGLVLARSQFESSMHYRSAMVLGTCDVLWGEAKATAMLTLTERLMPGRGQHARAGSDSELAATTVLSLPLDEWSVKVSDAPPDDAEDDLDRPVWAGVVPLRRAWGAPVPAPDLRFDLPVPAYVGAWRPRG
ncbi:MAG TPA: pyridoxamine 5'-phosphate oxidase family protein [Actinomycetales bacterium]|nr:pyridoxamine 5'-phosphate oxidase family protein [Actinomycetales bacterium]